MRYIYELTVPANTPATAPTESEKSLVTGKLKQVEIAFPPGPASLVKVIIVHGMLQISPANPDGYHAWDDYTEVFSMDYPLSDPAPVIKLVGWSPGTTFQHKITFRFDIVPRKSGDLEDMFKSMLGAPLVFGKGV